jgi:UMF1 family MFS transporter
MTKKEISWILNDVGNSAFSIIIMTAILPTFFKDVVAKDIAKNISTAYWGYINSISTILIAVMAPILGTIADIKNFKKKLFFSFTMLGVIATALLFFINTGDIPQCLIIYAFALFGFAGSNIFYDSFITDVTKKNRMDKISATGFACGYIGSTIPYITSILIILFPRFFGIHDKILSIKITFLITAIWWLAFAMPLFFNVKQEYFNEITGNPITESFKKTFATLKEIKNYKIIFLFLIAYFFYIDGVDTIIKMAGVFGNDLGISTKELIVILLVIQIVAFPFALIFGKLAQVFGTKKMILAGISVYSFIVIYAFFMKTVIDFWILALLTATSQGGIQALSRSYFGKIIPNEKSAEFFGFYNIFGRFSTFIGPLMFGFFSQITGNSKIGVLSILLLFITGGIIFYRIKEDNFKTENQLTEN